MALAAREGQRSIVGINITPLVDIVLVLLIIFMATAHLISQRSLNMSLPKMASAQPSQVHAVRVTLLADRSLHINDARVTSPELARALGRMARLGAGLRVTLGADERVSWGEVAGVLDVIRGAGVSMVSTEVEADS